MIEVQPLNEIALTREVLKRIGDPKSVFARSLSVLELVNRNGVGLGEVLQDYAAQGLLQLRDVIRAAQHVTQGGGGPEDREILEQIHFTLKSVKAVLEMTPAAMQRNKSEVLGEKERLSRADIAEITHAFLSSPDIVRLLAVENSGSALASLVGPGADETVVASGEMRAMAAASH